MRVPTMLVVVKATGRNVVINEADFDPALHERPRPGKQAKSTEEPVDNTEVVITNGFDEVVRTESIEAPLPKPAAPKKGKGAKRKRRAG